MASLVIFFIFSPGAALKSGVERLRALRSRLQAAKTLTHLGEISKNKFSIWATKKLRLKTFAQQKKSVA
jgi:hypothetical protein